MPLIDFFKNCYTKNESATNLNDMNIHIEEWK